MKKALIVFGGWDGHNPRGTAELFANLLREKGLEVETRDTLDALIGAQERGYALIVPMWTMGQITHEQLVGVGEAVARGTGLAGFHGGMGDAFRNETWWQFITGSQFVAHPGDLCDYTVDIRDRAHPITRGLEGFAMRSEQYYLHVDPAVHVLATTTFSGEHHPDVKGVVMPVAYTKSWNLGRVFYCSLGHQLADFDVPQARALTLNGMLWAAGVLA